MPPALGRLRHRYRRRRSLGGRLDQGHRLGGDDGKRSSRRGMRNRASCSRARWRHVGIQRHETGHHQAANHDKVLQDKHHFPLGPQGPPHSISRGSGRVGSFPLRPCAWVRCRACEGDGGGGMVSNHRLVLFTHALCRLSYPAVGPTVTRPGLAGLFKIAHPRARPSGRRLPRCDARSRPRPDGESSTSAARDPIAFPDRTRFSPAGRQSKARGDNP